MSGGIASVTRRRVYDLLTRVDHGEPLGCSMGFYMPMSVWRGSHDFRSSAPEPPEPLAWQVCLWTGLACLSLPSLNCNRSLTPALSRGHLFGVALCLLYSTLGDRSFVSF